MESGSPVWLIAIRAPRRLRFQHTPADGREPVEFDTRVTALDLENVARVVARLAEGGLPARLSFSRRGVAYAIVPMRYLRYLVFEEPDTWSVAETSLRYLRGLHREARERRHWTALPADPGPPTPPPPAPATPSGDYEAYEW